ncbi:hypothetical protein EHI2019_000011700 [Entamoeba histolytica]
MFFLLYQILQSISAHIANFFFGSVLVGFGVIMYAYCQRCSARVASLCVSMTVVIAAILVLFLIASSQDNIKNITTTSYNYGYEDKLI